MTEVFGNRYEVIERVGDGGMATVYRGLDRVLKRDVAIKVMHPHLAGRADARQRFNREAQAIARLHHTNIVDVFDFSLGTDENAYLITEFVHGDTLTRFVMDHGPFLPQAAALIGHAVASALEHAHGVGIVHRDIKPDNLMISKDGHIKLMDFGIATAMDLEQMTATGAIVGSPAHMAPEQIEGGPLDHRCDIFAFGTVLYYLVTRKLPFVASNPHALFRMILEGRYEAASKHNPQVDRGFDSLIAQCLARQPADRWPTMTAVQNALSLYLKQFRMSDVATLLPRFLKAPEVFQFDLKPSLVQILTAEGRRYGQANQLALAIDSLNRALVLDADADEPRLALRELTVRSRRRKQFRRLTVLGAVAAGLLLIAWVGWALLQEVPSDQPVTVVKAPLSLPALPAATTNRWPTQPLPQVVTGTQVPAPQPLPEPAVAGNAINQHVRPSVDVDVRKAAVNARVLGWRLPVKNDPHDTKLADPPGPSQHYRVSLGSNPPSASLVVRRLDRPGPSPSGDGFLAPELETGSYVLTCTFPSEACADCTPAELKRERRFEVPVRPGVAIKCERPEHKEHP